MARQQQDRENLLAEATGLIERASLMLDGRASEIVVGFRRDGSVAFYFDPECVYQFTSDGLLRRAFVAPLIYKAQHGQLVSLCRVSTDTEVQLRSRTLDDASRKAFLTEMQTEMLSLRTALDEGQLEVRQQVPAQGDLPGRLRLWLATHWPLDRLANSPHSA